MPPIRARALPQPGMTNPDPSTPTSDEPVTAENAPVSFGVFNPVGKVVVGLPSQDQLDAVAHALAAEGWQAEDVVEFIPPGAEEDISKMADSASALADFGYERTLLNRYRDMTHRGVRWLLVTVEDLDHAQRLAAIAKAHGAEMATYYRRFAIEELI